ncbi:MAG: hypothetical protein ACLPID_10350 [Beijerinckiaceae bacterium]
MTNAVIAGHVRTPFSFACKGALKEVRPADLAGNALKVHVSHAAFQRGRAAKRSE